MPVETAPPDTGTSHRALRAQRWLPGESPWVAMYHSVDDCSDDPYKVTVSPERLQQQLVWLRERGLRGVSVAQLLDALARGTGRGLVGLTFDDGYSDFVDNALPLLRHYGCHATVFVLPGRLGGENAWDPLGPRKPLLTAQGVRAAAAAGMEIGSHGLTHISLTEADAPQLRAEIRESKALLEQLTGVTTQGFCYPYGDVSRPLINAVREAGYRYGCAISPRQLTGVYALPRVHIGESDTPRRLELKRRLYHFRRRAWTAAPSTTENAAENAAGRRTAGRRTAPGGTG